MTVMLKITAVLFVKYISVTIAVHLVYVNFVVTLLVITVWMILILYAQNVGTSFALIVWIISRLVKVVVNQHALFMTNHILLVFVVEEVVQQQVKQPSATTARWTQPSLVQSAVDTTVTAPTVSGFVVKSVKRTLIVVMNAIQMMIS